MIRLSPTAIAESTLTVRSDGSCEIEIRFDDGTTWTQVVLGCESDARLILQRILDSAIAERRRADAGAGR